jgi:pimeloyl-ACP methyl ester carboxylesterase
MANQLAGSRATATVTAAESVTTYEVRGGDGLRLHVREWGQRDGPELLFIHGWSQSDLCWTKQVSGHLAARFRIVTFDLRGHGLSEAPAGAGHYTEPSLWADDIAAVIEQAGLKRPVLIAWSYGGFIVSDYLRVYGEGAVGGINLVGGAVILRPPTFDHIGPGFLENAGDAAASDLGTNIAAVQRFLRACTAEPLDEQDVRTALAWNMVAPPSVRGALISREIDGSAEFAALSVPVLVSHGRADAIVLPSMAEHVLDACRTATPSWYDGVGHMPFWESAERFDLELAEFCDRVHSELHTVSS